MVAPKNFIEVLERDCCRWLGSDIGKNEYCGEPRKKGSPYCAKHHAVAYKPVDKKKRKDYGDVCGD